VTNAYQHPPEHVRSHRRQNFFDRNLNRLHPLAPNPPNIIGYSRIRRGFHWSFFHGFHAGQHASHYGVLEFRSPLTACGITAEVDGVDGLPRGFESLAAQSREPGIESGIANVGPFSPFPMRTKMRLKLLAAGTPTATSPDGADPARPGRPRRTTLCPSRSVSNLTEQAQRHPAHNSTATR